MDDLPHPHYDDLGEADVMPGITPRAIRRRSGHEQSFPPAVLAITALIGVYVGFWAEVFPRDFYTSFPGFGLHRISMDGVYDEHLILDVGSLYLALTAISVAAIFARTAARGRTAGLAWTVFGILHFAYHLAHLKGSAVDKIGNVVTLGGSAVLGIILLFPPRIPDTAK